MALVRLRLTFQNDTVEILRRGRERPTRWGRRDLSGQRWPRASAEPPAPDTETRAAVGTSPHMREAARGQRGPGSAFLVREKVVLSPSTFHYADGGARAPPAAALGPRGSAVPSCDLRARVPRFPWAASIARPP